MTDKPENPQAFPTHDGDENSDPRNKILTGGMTLRDYFAAHCPITLTEVEVLFKNNYRPENNAARVVVLMETFAKARWDYADTMLKARE